MIHGAGRNQAAVLHCCLASSVLTWQEFSHILYMVELETMMACLDWCLKVMAEMKVMGNAVLLQKLFVMLQLSCFCFYD